MTDLAKPAVKPARPHFSSGPCAKRPGYDLQNLGSTPFGRSHRSKIGKARLKEAIERTRAALEIPDTHRIGVVPASDTGAYEMAMWTMLGARPVDALAWESFGQGWVTDAVKQLKLDANVMTADYGALPDLSATNPAHDILFTWNGTTSGARVPDADWISGSREGLTLCDATSAAFAQDLPWEKLDATTFSWQKAIGGEAAHGVLVLGPRAVERLESYAPDRPLPKIFRLTKGGKLIEDVFEGATINTPSMLCVEDYLDALQWALSEGGLRATMARADRNAATLDRWVQETGWVDHLVEDPAIRSNTSVCLRIVDPAFAALTEDDQRAVVKRMDATLEAESAAYDVAGYRDAPPGLRIWCGSTVDAADVEALGPWLDWAFRSAMAERS